jgi:hypothetical protein
MPTPFLVRARIAELEEQERLLQNEDRHFWEKPEHTPEAQAAYSQRRAKIRSVREELQALQRDLAIELIRAPKR